MPGCTPWIRPILIKPVLHCSYTLTIFPDIAGGGTGPAGGGVGAVPHDAANNRKENTTPVVRIIRMSSSHARQSMPLIDLAGWIYAELTDFI
jgi:hypothetical protein